jgi:hypothetical protein
VYDVFVSTASDILMVAVQELSSHFIYNHPTGMDTGPTLITSDPSVAVDSWISTPGSTALVGDGFQLLPGDEAAWFDVNDNGPQIDFPLARLTVPDGTEGILGGFLARKGDTAFIADRFELRFYASGDSTMTVVGPYDRGNGVPTSAVPSDAEPSSTEAPAPETPIVETPPDDLPIVENSFIDASGNTDSCEIDGCLVVEPPIMFFEGETIDIPVVWASGNEYMQKLSVKGGLLGSVDLTDAIDFRSSHLYFTLSSTSVVDGTGQLHVPEPGAATMILMGVWGCAIGWRRFSAVPCARDGPCTSRCLGESCRGLDG